VDYGRRHGYVEAEHGGDPGKRLRPAESRGNAYPGAANHA
jgi:hypothetical protein